MHGYKHSIDEFAEVLGGVVTSSGNGVTVRHPFDESRNVLVYPNRNITSKTAFFVQIDDEENTALRRHFGKILSTAEIDARNTGLNDPAPDHELIIATMPMEPFPETVAPQDIEAEIADSLA